jgi:hypothetical protein
MGLDRDASAREDGRPRFAEFQRGEQRRAISTEFWRFRDVGKQARHFGERRYCAWYNGAGGPGRQLRAFGNTDARLVGSKSAAKASHVVGRNHRDASFLTQRHAARDEGFIFSAARRCSSR